MLPPLAKGGHCSSPKEPRTPSRSPRVAACHDIFPEETPIPSPHPLASLWNYEANLQAACSYVTNAPKIVTCLDVLDDPSHALPAHARATRVWQRSVSNTVDPSNYDPLSRQRTLGVAARPGTSQQSQPSAPATSSKIPFPARQKMGLLRLRSVSMPEADLAEVLQRCRSRSILNEDMLTDRSGTSQREEATEEADDANDDGSCPVLLHLPSIGKGAASKSGANPGGGLFRQRSVSCGDGVHVAVGKTPLQRELSLLRHVTDEDDRPPSEMYRLQCADRVGRSRLGMPAWHLAQLRLLGVGNMLPNYESEHDYSGALEAKLDSLVSKVKDLETRASKSGVAGKAVKRPVVTDTQGSQYRNLQAKSVQRRGP